MVTGAATISTIGEKTGTSSSMSSSLLPSMNSPDLAFPWRLFLLLKNVTLDEQTIISWTDDGTAFQVHKKKEFELVLLSKYFKTSKYKSFTRQLCGYGFSCVKQQQIQNKQDVLSIWSHPDFIRDNPDRCSNITRRRKKKKKKKKNPTTTTKSKTNNSKATTTTTYNNNASHPNMSAAIATTAISPSTVCNGSNFMSYSAFSVSAGAGAGAGAGAAGAASVSSSGWENSSNNITKNPKVYSSCSNHQQELQSQQQQQLPRQQQQLQLQQLHQWSQQINQNALLHQQHGQKIGNNIFGGTTNNITNSTSTSTTNNAPLTVATIMRRQQQKQQQQQQLPQQPQEQRHRTGTASMPKINSNNNNGCQTGGRSISTSSHESSIHQFTPAHGTSFTCAVNHGPVAAATTGPIATLHNTIIHYSDTDGDDGSNDSNNSNSNSNIGSGSNPKKPTATLSTIPEQVTMTMPIDEDHHQDQKMNEDDDNMEEEDWFEPLLLGENTVLDDNNKLQISSWSSSSSSSSSARTSSTTTTTRTLRNQNTQTTTPTIQDLDKALETLCSDDDTHNEGCDGSVSTFADYANADYGGCEDILNDTSNGTGGGDLAFEPRRIEEMDTDVSLKPTGGIEGMVNNNSNGSNNNNLSFEPRRIEEMVVEPLYVEPSHLWYDWCPAMKPTQQAIMEYSLPLTLPGMFYTLKLSQFGLAWCFVIIIGHTLETLFTSFGPTAEHLSYRAMIGPIQHHLMDCMWVHTLISAMLIWPHHFDESIGFIMGLCLIQTLPIYLSVSFKTHFINNMLPQQVDHQQQQKPQKQMKTKTIATTEIPTTCTTKHQLQQVHRMRCIIRDCFLLYMMSTLGCIVGEYFLDKQNEYFLNCIKMLSVFIFNITPLNMRRSYMHEVVASTSGSVINNNLKNKKTI